MTAWKDTNIYPFAAKYDYPLAIRNRCLFFWATTDKGWRKTINLADKCTEPNRICIVYLYGEEKEEIITKHIAKIGNQNVVVLRAGDISKNRIKAIMDGVEAIKQIRKWGICDGDPDNQNPYEGLMIKPEFESTIPPDKAAEISDGKLELEKVKAEIAEKGFTRNGEHMSADSEQHITDLYKIICRIYPYGAEVDTRIDIAYKLLKFKKMCRSGIDGDTKSAEKIGVHYDDSTMQMQLSMFDANSLGASEFVREFRGLCDENIEKNGFVALGDILKRMSYPPYGFYQCNYYGLCVGYALRKYRTGYYESTCLATQKAERAEFAELVDYISSNMERYAPVYIYTQSEKQISLAEKLMEIFPPEYEIKTVCLQNVLSPVRGWFTENVLYDTVQRTIPELFDIVNLWEPCVLSKATEKYADWLTAEKAEEIKQKIWEIDSNFLKMVTEKYGKEKVDLYAKSHYVKGGAVGWLHSVETVDRGVKEYMEKETVCRECGAVIHNFGYQIFESDFNRKPANLTKQNIINLNKKFLGRYQNEYFCLNCLCEYLDMTEWELYEKMLRFKEQGCELF